MFCEEGAHDVVEHGGERTCQRCGYVLETSVLVADFAFGVPPARKSSFYTWQCAVKAVLKKLGLPPDLAASFERPFQNPRVSDSCRRLAGGLRLETQAARCVLLRFGHCISAAEARAACGASAQEWRRAAVLFDEAEPSDETGLLVYREVRRRGLPEQIAKSTLQAMEEPRLECCDPLRVLLASAAESLGDAVAAQVFDVSLADAAAARAKYRLPVVADLTAVALALQFCFERCLKSKSEGGQPGEEDDGLQAHLVQCSSCALRAQELGLTFLWRKAI
jgi:hypothetical protein